MRYLQLFFILTVIYFNIFIFKHPFLGIIALSLYFLFNINLYQNLFSIFDSFRQKLITLFFILSLLTLLATLAVDLYKLTDNISFAIYTLVLFIGLIINRYVNIQSVRYKLIHKPLFSITLSKRFFLIYSIFLLLFIISFLHYRAFSPDDWLEFFGKHKPFYFQLSAFFLIGLSFLAVIASRNVKIVYLIITILFGVVFFSRVIFFGLQQIQFGDVGRTIADEKIILSGQFLEPAFSFYEWRRFGLITLPEIFVSSKFFHAGIYGLMTILNKVLYLNINYLHILFIPTLFTIIFPMLFFSILQLINKNLVQLTISLFAVIFSGTLIYTGMFPSAGSLGVLFFNFFLLVCFMLLEKSIPFYILVLVWLTNLLAYSATGIIGVILFSIVIILKIKKEKWLWLLIPVFLLPFLLYSSFNQTKFFLLFPQNFIFLLIKKLENWNYLFPNSILFGATLFYVFSNWQKVRKDKKQLFLIASAIILIINDFLILVFLEGTELVGYRIDLLLHSFYIIFLGLLLPQLFKYEKYKTHFLLYKSLIFILLLTQVYTTTKYDYRFPQTATEATKFAASQVGQNEEIFSDADLASFWQANYFPYVTLEKKNILFSLSNSDFIPYKYQFKNYLYEKNVSSFWLITSPWQMGYFDIVKWQTMADFRKDFKQFSVLHIKTDNFYW